MIEELINLLGISSIIALVALVIALMGKMEKIRQLESSVSNLQRSLDEMDEQAKLIVRTDIELNKTQEELDKKVSGLFALQRLSRAMSSTLLEGDIFKQINLAHLQDLGFEKGCVFLRDQEENRFTVMLTLGYLDEDRTRINALVNSDTVYYDRLIQEQKTVSSISLTTHDMRGETIKNAFNVVAYVIAPISPKEGKNGLLFAGIESQNTIITEGDEELVSILASQIGQALENSHLFEATWHAQQDLSKKVEERTRELKKALEEVNRISKRKTDFISAVSHELRTPLTSIKGYASILLTGKLGDLPEDVRLRLEKINRHSDELTHLVNDLLDISRIQSGKVSMKTEKLDLTSVVNSVFDMLSVQFKERQIGNALKIPEDARVVIADPSQLNRVFINLVGNALKFTPENGTITVASSSLDDKRIQINVIDTGCGIDPSLKETIFEEFYRVDNAINENVKGTGLGLSLVKNIVEAHGGTIWVDSKPNQGSTFSFILPKP